MFIVKTPKKVPTLGSSVAKSQGNIKKHIKKDILGPGVKILDRKDYQSFAPTYDSSDSVFSFENTMLVESFRNYLGQNIDDVDVDVYDDVYDETGEDIIMNEDNDENQNDDDVDVDDVDDGVNDVDDVNVDDDVDVDENNNDDVDDDEKFKKALESKSDDQVITLPNNNNNDDDDDDDEISVEDHEEDFEEEFDKLLDENSKLHARLISLQKERFLKNPNEISDIEIEIEQKLRGNLVKLFGKVSPNDLLTPFSIEKTMDSLTTCEPLVKGKFPPNSYPIKAFPSQVSKEMVSTTQPYNNNQKQQQTSSQRYHHNLRSASRKMTNTTASSNIGYYQQQQQQQQQQKQQYQQQQYSSNYNTYSNNNNNYYYPNNY